MGNSLDLVGRPGLETRRANYRACRSFSSYLHRRPEHNNQPLCRKQRLMTESVLDQQYPITIYVRGDPKCLVVTSWYTCIVTKRSSTRTSFVKKSAPIVAL